MANFKIGDKVKIINFLDEYDGKTGRINRDAGKERIPKCTRELGKGFETSEGQQQWLVMLDKINETIVVPENNLEIIS